MLEQGFEMQADLGASRTRFHFDEDANNMAAAYVKKELSAEERERLLQPENIERLHNALVSLHQDIESQFAERKAGAQEKQNQCHDAGWDGRQEWFEYKARYDRWRSSARRFLSAVTDARRDVKSRIAEYARAGQFAPNPEAKENSLKQENHRLRVFLAAIMDNFNLSTYHLYDFDINAQDAPFARVERSDDDEWVARLERHQE